MCALASKMGRKQIFRRWGVSRYLEDGANLLTLFLEEEKHSRIVN